MIRNALKGLGNRDSGTLSGYKHNMNPDLGRRLSRKRLHLPQAVFQVAVHCAKSGSDMDVGEVIDLSDGKDSIT